MPRPHDIDHSVFASIIALEVSHRGPRGGRRRGRAPG